MMQRFLGYQGLMRACALRDIEQAGQGPLQRPRIVEYRLDVPQHDDAGAIRPLDYEIQVSGRRAGSPDIGHTRLIVRQAAAVHSIYPEAAAEQRGAVPALGRAHPQRPAPRAAWKGSTTQSQ